MALYLLSYDIPKKDEKINPGVYDDLDGFLESQNAVRILQTAWLVPWGDESNAEALVEAVSQHAEKNFQVIACKLFSDKRTNSWRNLRESDRVVGDLFSRHAQLL